MLKAVGLQLPAVIGVHNKPSCDDDLLPPADPDRLSGHRDHLVPNSELQHGKAGLLRAVNHIVYYALNPIIALHRQPPQTLLRTGTAERPTHLKPAEARQSGPFRGRILLF
ncbi:hypothetical protein DSECCO2_599670 [anaerobic digester metagenome]